MEISIASVALNYILEHGGSGYFLESHVLPLIQQQKLFRVDDSVEMYINLFMVFNVDRKNDHSVRMAIDGLNAVKES